MKPQSLAALTARHRSRPFISGMLQSATINQGLCSATIFNAMRPFSAHKMWCPAEFMKTFNSAMIEGSSSTIRIGLSMGVIANNGSLPHHGEHRDSGKLNLGALL